MNTYKRLLILASLFGLMGLSAFADPITYLVTVNTSSIDGTAGSLDFQFDPGADSQTANVQILNFTSDGTLDGAPVLTGDASGDLSSTVNLDNLTGYNDYFQDFTFGDTLSFYVDLYGPALTSPSGGYTSESEFIFSMFSDPAGTVTTLTSNTTYGDAVDITVLPDSGNTSVTNYSSETSVAPVPEPGTLATLVTGLLGLGCCVKQKLFS